MDENAKRWVVKRKDNKYLADSLNEWWTTSQIYASRFTRDGARLYAWKYQAAMYRLVSKAEKAARR